MDEGFLLRAKKTYSTDFWKNFSFQRNLGFDLGAVEEKKGSVHMAKYLLELQARRAMKVWISWEKREQKTWHSQRPFTLAFILLVCKFMGGRVWSEEGRRQDKVMGKKPIKN